MKREKELTQPRAVHSPLLARRPARRWMTGCAPDEEEQSSVGLFRRLLLLVRSATGHPPSGWSTGEKRRVHCPRLSEFLLPLHVHLSGVSQPTSCAGPRRL